MAAITFDAALFRKQIPAYADPEKYPDATIESWWEQAACYISTEDYGWLNGNSRALAINLMTAHLMTLSTAASSGAGQTAGAGGIVTGATIDKVSVTLAAPPSATDEWEYWLSLTPFGQRLLALLRSKSVGGFYVGLYPELSAFRKAGGRF
ncbi:DUF4054 domain-containing protein [Salmonella enterica subsp. enterica serovar Gatineau]|uniref:DUF4054 domain-containing protein n=1 Tax=Salmonella enterica subsp. enterica serovar Abeokuta TaxID=2926665 RepID=A0A8T9IE11_SALET|nr:DUF4054 domain-containing protein [Salmonella enterica]EGG4117014.1 DUF4054 domain-containing protein [Salmonella enterica]EGG4130816.1 DUF4054 domain-containing protein [Salmonella enterica]MDR7933868.1 DUF4054 domain-containing protein [Salmonella enterica subsp. enterica serovar Gatineau]UNO32293.1 DUF4054 domain-containing protein [Salmonella enterica subsp. enterica serovar Abeokuta]